MRYLCLFVLLLPAGLTAVAQEETPQATSAPTTQEGPMRIELFGLREVRELYPDPRSQYPDQSRLHLGMTLAGARLEQVVRIGRAIITEAVDEAGKVLVAPDAYDEDQRTATNPVNVTPDVIQRGGLQLGAQLTATTRGAATIAKLKGTVRVVYAGAHEEITVFNPRAQAGSLIEHPRLKELGISVRVMPPGDPKGAPAQENVITLQFLPDRNRVRGVAFHDAWMKKLTARDKLLKTNDGEDCVSYQVSRGWINEDAQMVLEIYPEIEETQIPIEFSDVPLP